MKFSLAITSLALATTGLADPAAKKPSRQFSQVPLREPRNWEAGPKLFPAEVIAGYHADLNKYNEKSWSEYVLNKCKGFDSCTSSITYQARNSGTPKKDYWFGYVFRGGPTDQSYYVRGRTVKHSIAYSVKRSD